MSVGPELIVLAISGCLGLVLLEQLIKRSWLAALLVVGIMIVHASTDPPMMALAGFNVYPRDILVALLAPATIARLLRLQFATRLQLGVILLALLVVASLARGIVSFEVTSAFNQARGTLPFVVTALYFSTAVPSKPLLDRIGSIWLYAAAALSLLALARWAASALGMGQVGILQPTASFSRVLDAHETLFIAQAFFMALLGVTLRWRSRWLVRGAAVFLPVAILLQHRTVWVILLAGLALLALRYRVLRGPLATVVLAAVVLGAVSAFLLFPEEPATVGDTLTESATTTDTFRWRTQGWEGLLDNTSGWAVIDHGFGEPFGASLEREVDTVVVESQPHNYYLQLYLRVGLVGLLICLLIYAGTVNRIRRIRDNEHSLLSSEFLLFVLTSHLLLFITYAPQMEQGILTGLAVGVAAASARPARAPLDTDPRAAVESRPSDDGMAPHT